MTTRTMAPTMMESLITTTPTTAPNADGITDYDDWGDDDDWYGDPTGEDHWDDDDDGWDDTDYDDRDDDDDWDDDWDD